MLIITTMKFCSTSFWKRQLRVPQFGVIPAGLELVSILIIEPVYGNHSSKMVEPTIKQKNFDATEMCEWDIVANNF